MHKIIRPILVLLALAATAILPGCNADQIARDEAYLLQLVTSAKAGVKMAVRTANTAADMICGYSGAAVADMNATKDAVGLTGLVPGPRTSAALNAANSAVASLQSACDARSASTSSAKVAAMWDSYAKAKAAIASAKAASGG